MKNSITDSQLDKYKIYVVNDSDETQDFYCFL